MLAKLVYRELQRLATKQWVQHLTERGEELPASSEALAESYAMYERELATSGDVVTAATVQFMTLMGDVLLYESGIALGDAYVLEVLTARWMPIHRAGGKSQYVASAAHFMETAYGAMTAAQLHVQRCNRMTRLRGGARARPAEPTGESEADRDIEAEAGMIAHDDLNEHMNLWMKRCHCQQLHQSTLFV